MAHANAPAAGGSVCVSSPDLADIAHQIVRISLPAHGLPDHRRRANLGPSFFATWSNRRPRCGPGSERDALPPASGLPLRRAPGAQGPVASEPLQTARLELAGTLLGDAHLAGDLAERCLGGATGAEPQLDHPALVLRQCCEGGVDRMLLLALVDFLLDALRALRSELAESRVPVVADRGVEARGDPGQVANGLDLIERKLGAIRDLLLGGLAVQARAELRLHAIHRALPLRDVRRDANRPPGVVQAALDRLLDPQNRVGGELVAAPVVELLGSANQPEHGLLDQVLHRQAMALVTAG